MPLDKRQRAYIWDMQNAAKEIREFMRGVKFHQFEKNKVCCVTPQNAFC